MAETCFEAALLSSHNGEASISLAGDVTEHAVTFAAVLEQALATAPARLIINLRHASSLNNTAVAVLNTAARRADARNVDIVVREADAGSRHQLAALEPNLVTVEG